MNNSQVLKKNIEDLRDIIAKRGGVMPGGATFHSVEEQETVSPPVAREVWEAKKNATKPFVMPVKAVVSNPYNRDLDEEKILDMKRGILRSGEVKPLVVTEIDKDGESALMITDGHHRYEALKQLGRKEIPVVMADDKGTHTADGMPKEEVEKKTRKQNPAYEKETELINENKEKPENKKPHAFKAATWTHTNGHPRCLRCGDEEPVGKRCNMSPSWYKEKYVLKRAEDILKHLPGEHDQASHSPTGQPGREGAVAGTLEAGAIHLATIAVPAVIVAGLLRVAPMVGLGAIGVTTAFILYETPQLLFRMVEGGVRGYHGERPYRFELEEEKKFAKVEVKDLVGRTITRGDHVLVKGKKGAYVGTYMGQDVVRVINKDKFVDLKTTPKNRIKISTEDKVLSTDPKDAKITLQVAEQLVRERKFLIDVVAKEVKKVTGAHEGVEPVYSITGLDREGRRGRKYQDHRYGSSSPTTGQSGFGIPTAGVGAHRT